MLAGIVIMCKKGKIEVHQYLKRRRLLSINQTRGFDNSSLPLNKKTIIFHDVIFDIAIYTLKGQLHCFTYKSGN